MKKETVAWECSCCGHRHFWRWERGEAETAGSEVITMCCDNRSCKAEIKTLLVRIGSSAWAAKWPGVSS